MSTKFLVIIVAINAVLGQLLLKHALNSLGGRDALAALPQFIANAAKSPWIYSSLAVQGFGYFLWILLLSREKMGVVAAGVGAGFYLLLPLSAWVIYGETLSQMQWFGIALLTAGITFINFGTT